VSNVGKRKYKLHVGDYIYNFDNNIPRRLKILSIQYNIAYTSGMQKFHVELYFSVKHGEVARTIAGFEEWLLGTEEVIEKYYNKQD